MFLPGVRRDKLVSSLSLFSSRISRLSNGQRESIPKYFHFDLKQLGHEDFGEVALEELAARRFRCFSRALICLRRLGFSSLPGDQVWLSRLWQEARNAAQRVVYCVRAGKQAGREMK